MAYPDNPEVASSYSFQIYVDPFASKKFNEKKWNFNKMILFPRNGKRRLKSLTISWRKLTSKLKR
jgi:hypothetical protein